MGTTLTPALTNFVVQTCALSLVLTAGLIVFAALARLMASRTWWRGWGQPDDD